MASLAKRLTHGLLASCLAVLAQPAFGQGHATPHLRDAGTEPVTLPKAESSTSIAPEQFDLYLDRLEAVEAIKRLIASFSYYRSSNLPGHTVALFSADGSVDFAGGKWIGHQSLLRLFEGRFRQAALRGTTGPQPGVLSASYSMQPVIDVGPDARTAAARFREVEYWGQHSQEQTYGAKLYEAVFTKNADGVWTIQSLTPCQAWKTDYGADLSTAPMPEYPAAAPVLYPEAADGPDRLSSQVCVPWPFGGITPPMHYPHPVTGEFINKP